MSKRRGFTLVEVIVVMALATLVFALVGGFMIYMAESTGNIIDKSEEIMTTQTIEDYIRSLIKTNEVELKNLVTGVYDINSNKNENGYIRLDQGNIYKESDLVFKDTGLDYFSIITEDGFYVCVMRYESGREYQFILGVDK